jgi:hypothetical protein
MKARSKAIPPQRPQYASTLISVILTLIFALMLVRKPMLIGIDSLAAYQGLLYETLRLGLPWHQAIATTDGPLAAVQSPGYAGGSIWMAMSWQIGGNLMLAAILIAALRPLSHGARWAAWAALTIILARLPTLAPWLATMVVAWSLIQIPQPHTRAILVRAGLLGFLGLSSIGHLLLGTLAVIIALMTLATRPARIATFVGFFGVLTISWMALGQPLVALPGWIQQALSLLPQTAAQFRTGDPAAPLRGWAAFAFAGLAATLASLAVRRRRSDPRAKPAIVLLFGAALLSWKAQALQPFGLPAIAFVTLATAALLATRVGAPRWIAGLAAGIAGAGLICSEPLIVTDGIGHFNRLLVYNVETLRALPTLRSTLQQSLRQAAEAHALPAIRADVGTARVIVMGAGPGYALFNQLVLTPRPAPLPEMVRSDDLVRRNRAILDAPDAPTFVLQRLYSTEGRATALEDSGLQLEVQRRYSVQREEKGIVLWRRKAEPPSTPALITEGTLALDDRLSLPPMTTEGLSLEIDYTPSWLERALAWIDDAAAPGIRVEDAEGHRLYYTLWPSAGRGGFLIAPFIRGEPDLHRLQSGATVPTVVSLTPTAPVWRRWLAASSVRYRLYAEPELGVAGDALDAKLLDRYQLFSRGPVATASPYAIGVFPEVDGTPISFAHPPTTLEFATTANDQGVRGSFGLIDGAYRNGNATDGVDFSIEFIADDGTRTVLLHRWLNPRANAGDRGRQTFDFTLPSGRAGRLILRTDNPAARGAAWDWSYWGPVSIY